MLERSNNHKHYNINVFNDVYYGGNHINDTTDNNVVKQFIDDFNRAVHKLHHVDDHDRLVNPSKRCSICNWRIKNGRRASDRAFCPGEDIRHWVSGQVTPD